MYYEHYVQDGESYNYVDTRVPAITCDTYINKYLSDLHNFQLKSITKEMYETPENYLCPDIDTISIYGQLRH